MRGMSAALWSGMHKRYGSLALFLIVAVPITAFAGKQERDLMTNKVVPAVKDAQAKYKASCGCDLAITVDDGTLKTMDEIRSAQYLSEDISKSIVKYCTDDGSKKAMCQLKQLTITKGKAGFTFKDGKGVATGDGQMRCAFDQITRVLDK
jgi:hypothetical protein